MARRIQSQELIANEREALYLSVASIFSPQDGVAEVYSRDEVVQAPMNGAESPSLRVD